MNRYKVSATVLRYTDVGEHIHLWLPRETWGVVDAVNHIEAERKFLIWSPAATITAVDRLDA